MKWTISRSRGKGPTSPGFLSGPRTCPPFPLVSLPSPASLEATYSVLRPPLPSHGFPAAPPPPALSSPGSVGPSLGVTGYNKAPRLLGPLEACPLLLRKVRGGVGGVGLPEWGWSSWIPLMRPHYCQDPAGPLPPPVPMARARESCPARAACSGQPAQARAAKAQSPPWVEVSSWASWVTGPSWSQWPSQGLGPQFGLTGSPRSVSGDLAA